MYSKIITNFNRREDILKTKSTIIQIQILRLIDQIEQKEIPWAHGDFEPRIFAV